MTLEQVFKKAATERGLCELTEKGGNKRIVAPHGIFSASDGSRQFCCYQYSGFSESGGIPNWRNFHVDNIKAIKVLEELFIRRKDFNYKNKQVYPNWYFHI